MFFNLLGFKKKYNIQFISNREISGFNKNNNYSITLQSYGDDLYTTIMNLNNFRSPKNQLNNFYIRETNEYHNLESLKNFKFNKNLVINIL